MGSVGWVGVSLGRTGIRQLSASVLVLLAQACSIEQPISGPLALTAEWKDIDPPEPLRVGSKELQEVCLQVVGTTTDVDFEKGRLLVNGQWHVLGGEAVDDEQTKHDLRVGSLGGDTACRQRSATSIAGSSNAAGRCRASTIRCRRRRARA